MIRGRFAPSPSGLMHLGNAMVALLSWLQVRSCPQQGQYILRIEDIDGPRSKSEYVEAILEDMRWMELDWDEGPDSGGAYQPYTQSRRMAGYEAALSQLASGGWLYPCYCSRAQLSAIASAPHGLASEGATYPGTCRQLTPQQQQARAAKKTPSLRFAIPDSRLVYEDGIAGRQSFAAGAGGDFVVRRADGIWAYQLAVVVDDAAMAVTDVLRGYDLLDSTPRQIWLYQALELPVPRFSHVPLLLDPDGKRLSKRHGDLSLASIRKAGISSQLLTGYLAYWCGLIDKPEAVKPAELLSVFHLSKISTTSVTIRDEEIRLLAGL